MESAALAVSSPEPNAGILALCEMVLKAVVSPHTRRNYAKALDDLFALSAGRPLTRALFMEYRASMEALALPRSTSGSRQCGSWSRRPGKTA